MENPPQISLSELLHKLSELGGSDLHITTGTVPLVRVHGEIRPLGRDQRADHLRVAAPISSGHE